MAVLGDETRIHSQRLPHRFWSCDISVPTKPGRQLGRQTQRTWSETRSATGQSVHYDGQDDDMPAHTRRHQRGGRLPDCSQEDRTSEVCHISWTSVRQRGNIITFRSTGGTILNEFSCNRIEFECVGGVYRLRADTSAKRKSGTDGAKMLMGFEQDTAGAAEAQPARPGNVPVLPSESEVEQHELTHLPFRSWCRHCVRAKGKESPHHEASPRGVSKFATDCKFMGEDGTPITILAGHDGLTTAFFPDVVPCKGTSHGYAERCTCAPARNIHMSSRKWHCRAHLRRQAQSWHAHPDRNRVRREPSWRQQRQRQQHGSSERANQTIQRQIRAIRDYTETTERCDDDPCPLSLEMACTTCSIGH